MTHAISDFPDAPRDAVDRAAGALRRAKAVLAAANLFSDRASKRLNEANTRADLLQAKMADVVYAGRRAA